jgi:VWFA-related protein
VRLRVLLLPVVAVLGGVVAAQSPAPKPPAFRSAIELTTVTATVVDQHGSLVAGLPREAFTLFEDGEEQTITQFTNARVPVSLAVLLDVSDSMYGQRLQDAREAVSRFVEDSLQRGDEFTIIAFNHRQKVLTPWTNDPETAAKVMRPLQPFGSTAIYDAIFAALPLAETRNRQRVALLVISDGADTASDLSLRDVRSALLRNDAFVYAIAIDAPGRRPINAPINSTALQEITNQTGGRTAVVHSSGDLSTALDEIATELASQYLIGYTSPKGADGRFHTIRVRVPGTDDRVRARNGYVAEKRTP